MFYRGLLMLVFLGTTFFSSYAQRPFVTKWFAGESGKIVIPTDPSPQFPLNYEFKIKWRDTSGTMMGSDSLITGDYTIDGLSYGDTVIVEIDGEFPLIVAGEYESGEGGEILEIIQWGDIEWKSFENAFADCQLLDITAEDIPYLNRVRNMSAAFYNCKNLKGNSTFRNWDVSTVIDMNSLFFGAGLFNQDIGAWDVNDVRDMSWMFGDASTFNQDISNWNVKNVESMAFMFSNASGFNQDINKWNVKNVIDMSGMFSEASTFNQNINSWDVGNVGHMRYMFENAFSFNQNIGDWDVSNVQDMSFMFTEASSFNQNIGAWDLSKVKDMSHMFYNAVNFNQDISRWDVSNVRDMSFMFTEASSFNQDIGAWNLSSLETRLDLNYSGIDVDNYDKSIKGWSENLINIHQVSIEAMGLKYCNSKTERRSLMEENQWEFYGDYYDCDEVATMTSFINNSFDLYPNPTQNFLSVKSEKRIKAYSIYNIYGVHLQSDMMNGVGIDISGLSSGTYILSVEYVDGGGGIRKFVKS